MLQRSGPVTDIWQRVDVWLWHARFLKSRSLASRTVTEGKVRVNRLRVSKASHAIKVGDVVTAAIHGRVRVIRVLAIADRRGSPADAIRLYEDVIGTNEQGQQPEMHDDNAYEPTVKRIDG